MRKTLYMDVADRIAAYIKDSRLNPGDKLPTYRDFAKMMGISVHTVGSAIERLHYKGLVDIRPQSGIFVMEDAWKALYPNAFNWQSYFYKSRKVPVTVLKRFMESRWHSVRPDSAYVISNLNLSTEFGWYPLWRKADGEVMGSVKPEQISLTSVDDQMCVNIALAEYLAYYGLDVPYQNILPTGDSNCSLMLLALTFFAPGTVCYYVSPSMVDVSSLCEIANFVKIPLPTGDDGIDMEYFARQISKGAKAFLIVSPELALSGKSMSLQRRKELYNLCYANKIPIVELDEYRDYMSVSTPPLKAFDKHGIVFHVGNFNGTMGNALRVGWIAAAQELIERLAYVQLSMNIGINYQAHCAVCGLLADGSYRRYVSALQQKMRAREKALNSLLDEYLCDIAVWDRHSYVFFWIKFADHIDTQKVADNKDGLTLSEFSQYAFAEDNSIFISLTGMNECDLRPAIQLLSKTARKSIKV